MQILLISGKSGACKSTVERKIEKLGFKRVKSYTTRRMRPEEVDGEDYYFVNHETFDKLFNEGYIIEKTEYAGEWYGKEQLTGDTNFVAVVERSGIEAMKRMYGNQVTSVYLDLSTEEANRRRNSRSAMSEEENKKREESDRNNFEDIESVVDEVISIDKMTIDDIVVRILCLLKEKRG